MSNIRTEKREFAPETIDTFQLDDVTGGCGACRCGNIGGVAYSQRAGFGIDPLFMILAMQVFSQSK